MADLVATESRDRPPAATLATALPAAAAPPERLLVAPKWSAADPLGVLLTGTVRWRDGEVLAGTKLTAKANDLARNVVTAEDGSFAFVGLSPGECIVDVMIDRAANPTHTFTIPLGDDREQHHDLVLDRPVTVRVFATTPAGASLRDQLPSHLTSYLQAAAAREPLPTRLAPTQQARQQIGDATWRDEPGAEGALGSLQVTAPPAHAGLLLGHLVLQQQRIEAEQTEVRFVVDPASATRELAHITLRLVDAESGAALRGGVSLGTAGSSIGQTTDRDGRATFDAVFPGPVTLTTRVTLSRETATHEELAIAFRVAPGARIDLGELRLSPACKFTGRLVNDRGTTVAGSVDWIAANPATVADASPVVRAVQCDENGVFTLQGASRGRVAVVARFLDKAAFGVFDNPPPQPVELRLGPAALVVVTRGGDVDKTFFATCFDAERRPIASRTLPPRTRRAEILLPVGAWNYEVRDQDNRVVTSGTWQLDGAPCTLELP